MDCLDSVFTVCKAWRNAVLRITFHSIDYSGKNPARTLKIVKKRIVGHSIRTLSFDDIMLHFANYCPNVTAIYFSLNLKRKVWVILAQLPTVCFKKLTTLPTMDHKQLRDEYNLWVMF